MKFMWLRFRGSGWKLLDISVMDKVRRYGCRCWIIALWNHVAICTLLALSMYPPFALGSRNGRHFQSVGEASVKQWAFLKPTSPTSPPAVDKGNAAPPPRCEEKLCTSSPSLPAPPPPEVTQSPPVPSPSPLAPSPAPPTINTQEKAGVAIASVAALLQVIVVTYLLIKRRQMLALVDCDEYDHLNSNYGRLVSAQTAHH